MLPGMVSVWHRKVPAPEGEQTWQPKSDPRPNALNFGNFEQQDEWVRDAMLCLKNKTKPNKKPRPQTNKQTNITPPPQNNRKKTPKFKNTDGGKPHRNHNSSYDLPCHETRTNRLWQSFKSRL